MYERILNSYCRDRNTEEAWENPEKWRVPGALDFVIYLKKIGCTNSFVTGAVVYEEGGILEEVRALGFEIGPGKMIETIIGSSGDRKMPKDKIMDALFKSSDIDPKAVLVIGDGRSEIQAGADRGCAVMSRLSDGAIRQRELHRSLGTNYILPDFTSSALRELIY